MINESNNEFPIVYNDNSLIFLSLSAIKLDVLVAWAEKNNSNWGSLSGSDFNMSLNSWLGLVTPILKILYEVISLLLALNFSINSFILL